MIQIFPKRRRNVLGINALRGRGKEKEKERENERKREKELLSSEIFYRILAKSRLPETTMQIFVRCSSQTGSRRAKRTMGWGGEDGRPGRSETWISHYYLRQRRRLFAVGDPETRSPPKARRFMPRAVSRYFLNQISSSPPGFSLSVRSSRPLRLVRSRTPRLADSFSGLTFSPAKVNIYERCK